MGTDVVVAAAVAVAAIVSTVVDVACNSEWVSACLWYKFVSYGVRMSQCVRECVGTFSCAIA